jgi:hypothetical protein
MLQEIQSSKVGQNSDNFYKIISIPVDRGLTFVELLSRRRKLLIELPI